MLASGEYTGVGSEYVAGGGKDLGVPAKLLQGYAETFIDLYTRLPIPPVARRIVRDLLGLDPNGKPKPWLRRRLLANDRALRIAIIRRIDARLKLDGIIAGLPDDYLFGEAGRKELLDLNQLRDPLHLEQQARSLVPSGFFGWITYTHRRRLARARRPCGPSARPATTLRRREPWPLDRVVGRSHRRDAASLADDAGDRPRRADADSRRDPRTTQRRAALDGGQRARTALGHRPGLRSRRQGRGCSPSPRNLRADLRAKDNPLLTRIVDELKLYSEAGKRTVFVPEQTESSRAPVGGTRSA